MPGRKYISRIQCNQFREKDKDAPFALSVDLVLRERNVLEL